MIDTAIIVAGGLGTRLRPLTETIPKSMVPVKGKPALHYIVENLRKHNIENLIISINYKGETIQNYFKDGSHLGMKITYSTEEQPLGTGGAVKKAAQYLTKPFFLIYGDSLMNLDWSKMYNLFVKEKAEIVMALTYREDVENFGSTVLEDNKIIKFVNKPRREEAPSKIADIGAYIVDPNCLATIPEGKSSLGNACFEKYVQKGTAFGFMHTEPWFPLDTMEKYQEACQKFNPS